MAEFIQHEAHDETAWICLCGNTPHADGFAPCDYKGLPSEPTDEAGWEGLYCCARCQRVINEDNLQVVAFAPEVHRLLWRGIEIEARYWARKWGVIAHLEIQSIKPERAPLPLSDTGYRSHFHQPGTVEAQGGDVVAQVTAWLDKEAAKPERLAHVEASRQMSLF